MYLSLYGREQIIKQIAVARFSICFSEKENTQNDHTHYIIKKHLSLFQAEVFQLLYLLIIRSMLLHHQRSQGFRL
jgi:hypothetical protein